MCTVTIIQKVFSELIKFALFSGATFRTGKEKGTVVSAGTVVKNCGDLLPIIKLLTAEHASELNLDAPVDLKKLKYYYVEHTGDTRCSSVHADLKKCMKMYVNCLNNFAISNVPLVYVRFFFLAQWKNLLLIIAYTVQFHKTSIGDVNFPFYYNTRCNKCF